MKEKKKSFISIMSGIFKFILLICLFTVLLPSLSVRAEGEMVSLSRIGNSQLGYYVDPDGYCVYCADEMKKNADKGGEIYTKSIGSGYEIFDGIFGVEQEGLSEGKLDNMTVHILTQLAIWSKLGNSQIDAVEWYYDDNAVELFNRMMAANPNDYNVTHIIYTPSNDCYQPCVGAYSVSKKEQQHVHSWDAGTVTRESTYNVEGERIYTCTGCGETRTESIPKLVCNNHSWDEGKITTNPTYKTTGIKTYTCKTCGATKTESIPKLVCNNHSWDEGKITTKPTYKTTGIKTYTCKNCGKTKTEEVTKLKCTTHVYENAVLTPTDGGIYYYIGECTRCGEMHSSLHEHEFKWVTIKPASEEEAGIERHLCEECGYYTLEREIPKIEKHTCTHPAPRNFVETVSATCCSYPKGNVVCKECGEVIVYDYEYAKLGYNRDNHTHFTESVRVEPTYKTTGVKRFTCDGCGYYYTESIPRLDCPHAHTNIKDLADGSWKVCKDCGEKLSKVSSIPSRCNHIGTKKKQVLVKAPTSTEWGEAAMVCECGKTASTEKLHPYSEYQVTKPDGSVVTVYGWFDYEWAHEIAEQTNAYRVENGLNALHYNENLQNGSDQRALDTVVSFSHTRPNGTKWNTLLPQWRYGGENLASGQTTVESAMNAWKNSESHNANLLYGIKSDQTPFKGISVGVFHRYVFNSSSKPYTPNEYIYWTQEFTFN